MRLKNVKILIFVAEEYEDLELHYPKLRLQEEGAQVTVAGFKENEIVKGKNGYPCKVDVAFERVAPQDFDALVIPGGYAPDKLRTHAKVLEITKEFHAMKKLIAFICHAGWIPVSTGILKGVKCTSYLAIKDDVVNAGANWVDEPVVLDRHFISSRSPADLPYFCPAMISFLSKKEAYAAS